MWTYEQRTGILRRNGTFVARGYSGFEEGKNNPDMQADKGIGPCPAGMFTIVPIVDDSGAPIDYEGKKAPVFRLLPDVDTPMFGRDGMLVHGDSMSHPGQGSHGCVVEAHDVRLAMFKVVTMGDNRLMVSPGAYPEPSAAGATS